MGLGAHPVGTDVALVKQLVSSPKGAGMTGKIRDYLNGVTGVISIERLDYVKGSLEKLDAGAAFAPIASTQKCATCRP